MNRLRQEPKTEPLRLTVLRGVVPSAPSQSSDGASEKKPLGTLLPEDLDFRCIVPAEKSMPCPSESRPESELQCIAEERLSQHSANLSQSGSKRPSTDIQHSPSLQPAALAALNKNASRDDEGSSVCSDSGVSEEEADEIRSKGVPRSRKPRRVDQVKACQSDSSVPSMVSHS